MYKFIQKFLVFFIVLSSAFVLTSVFKSSEVCAVSGRTCCAVSPGGAPDYSNCDKCDTSGKYWKTSRNQSTGTQFPISCGTIYEPWGCQVTTTVSAAGIAAGEYACGADRPYGNACDSDTGGGGTLCTQIIGGISNPANLQIGQTKDFYGQASITKGNFVGMGASATNVPAGGTAVASVVKRSGTQACYANGNCIQGFRLAALSQGTSLVKVTTQVKSCPACSVAGTCQSAVTVNVGNIAPLACNPGARCYVGSPNDPDPFRVNEVVYCTMPQITDESMLQQNGTPTYYMECTPYAGTTAKTKIAKTSLNGSFPYFSIASGVTSIKCSFRYCMRTSSGITKCSDWGRAI